MKNRQFIYFIAASIGCLVLWLAVPYINPPKHQILGNLFFVAMLASFMFVQLSIPRWLAGMTMRPLWAFLALLGCVAVWISIMLAVSAPYARYDTKERGPVAVRITKNPMPKTMDIPSVKIERDKKGKVTTKKVKVKGTRGVETLSFKLFAFNEHAGKTRAVTTLLMIIAASVFGYLVSFILREPNIILPVAGLAAYVDVWTVMVGPTAKVIQNAPHVVSAVSAAIPAPGGASHGFMPISFIGPADFIFFAMFLGAAYRLKMEPNRTFWIGFPMLTVGMGAVLSGLFPIGLPALTIIGLSVILGNARCFKLKRDEYIAMIIVAVLLVGAMVAFTPMISKALSK